MAHSLRRRHWSDATKRPLVFNRTLDYMIKGAHVIELTDKREPAVQRINFEAECSITLALRATVRRLN